MFKVKEKVVYPVYGIGHITEVYSERIDEEDIEYYKINLPHALIDVSIPVSRAEKLGLRKPMTKKELKEALKDLGKTVRLDEKKMEKFDEITRELIRTGEIEDAIDVVNHINSFAKKKEKEGKPVAFTYTQRLEKALRFLRSIVSEILGEKALIKYDLEE